MLRVIEVSHWGNIAVEETLDLYHSGAALKGPFSRYDYQRQQDGIASIKSFKVCFVQTSAVLSNEIFQPAKNRKHRCILDQTLREIVTTSSSQALEGFN